MHVVFTCNVDKVLMVTCNSTDSSFVLRERKNVGSNTIYFPDRLTRKHSVFTARPFYPHLQTEILFCCGHRLCWQEAGTARVPLYA